MIHRFLIFIGFKSVKTLQARSTAIFNVFTSTATELNKVNEHLAEAKKKKSEEIDKKVAEHIALVEQQSINQKLVNKITEFLA